MHTDGEDSRTLTSAAEASQVGAAALVGQLEAVVHHLGGERRRLELVAHARLVHALHRAAALPGRRGGTGTGRRGCTPAQRRTPPPWPAPPASRCSQPELHLPCASTLPWLIQWQNQKI
jgi:hypothetical protein